MLPLNVDISPFIADSCLTDQEVKNFSGILLDNLALKFQEEWMKEVGGTLRSTRQEYINGMFVENVDDSTIVFGVTRRQSNLAVDLEVGKGAFDIKAGFENSGKKTLKKGGGWYLTIPFRHAGAGAVAESGAFAGVLPSSVQKAAKSQSGGVKMGQLSPEQQKLGVRPTLQIGNKTVEAYQHKAPILLGVKRMVDKDEGRGSYMTFRRVSDKSAPSSWWHKGFEAGNFLGKALDKLDVGGIVRKVRIDFFNNR